MDNFLIKDWQKQKPKAMRDGFGQSLLELAGQYQDLVVLTADLAQSTRVAEFSRKFPRRFFQLGVAEQNLIGVAAGLALAGKMPVCTSFASFLIGRAWEQIRICLAANRLPVKIIGSHAGLSHPADGFTAQATEDIALVNCLPYFKIIYPADFNQLKTIFPAVLKDPGPVYLRITREPTAVFIQEQAVLKIGQAQVLKEGREVTIISAGPLLAEVLLAAESAAKQGISCEVVNLATIKPLDQATLLKSIKKTGCFLTVEDHQTQGGLGAAVGRIVVKNQPVPGGIIGLENRFGQTAREYRQLLREYGLTAEAILKAIKKLVKRKK